MLGTLMNARGQMVAASYGHVEFPGFVNRDETGHGFLRVFQSASEAISRLYLLRRNQDSIVNAEQYGVLIPQAIEASDRLLDTLKEISDNEVSKRIDEWMERTGQWRQAALEFAQTKQRRRLVTTVEEERSYLESLRPSQTLIRPLLVVVPEEGM